MISKRVKIVMMELNVHLLTQFVKKIMIQTLIIVPEHPSSSNFVWENMLNYEWYLQSF